MNKTEQAYADMLEARRLAGDIRGWEYERHTLKIASDTRYTPDFEVVNKSGEIEFHEVKGHWRDDAKVKIKAAADRFRHYAFFAVFREPRNRGGGWKIEDFSFGA